MGLTDPSCKACPGSWDCDQVDMVGHQAPCQEGNAESLAVLSEEVEIGKAIGIREEDIHSPDASLRHVMRTSRNYNTSNPGHTAIVSYEICEDKTISTAGPNTTRGIRIVSPNFARNSYYVPEFRRIPLKQRTLKLRAPSSN